MEFTITCPIDGPITVSLEDIDTVVLREAERADITFVCPHCGAEITVTAVVPSFLLAAIEALAEEGDSPAASQLVSSRSQSSSSDIVFESSAEDAILDAYCEYFHRQLDEIITVEDALDEIDSNREASRNAKREGSSPT